MARVSLKILLQKIPLVPALGKCVKGCVMDGKVIPNFLSERRINRGDGPIRVAFFCQYIPAWTKVEPIYHLMREDERFEPYLICIPSGIRNNRLIHPDSLENDTYDYFREHGYEDAVNALVGKEKWLDLEAMGLSYIFYPRPYNSFMPECYTSRRVSRYSRVCIIMYGMTLTEEVSNTTLNRDFMASVYYYFAETTFAMEKNRKNNSVLHRLGLQKTVCLGMPVLEALSRKRNAVSPSWAFSKNQFRIMWTPRWTTDQAEGGSNFFTYYQRLLDYAEEHPDVDLLLRPHPLTFPHFIETGEMTAEEVTAYQARCASLQNVQLDTQSEYEATFWGSSVLVSDISGMMPEYFTTGKPLIYCASNMELKLSDFSRRMVEGCYVVYNEEELFHCLEDLQAGNDPLREKRATIKKELFGETCEGASARIVEELAKDWNERP